MVKSIFSASIELIYLLAGPKYIIYTVTERLIYNYLVYNLSLECRRQIAINLPPQVGLAEAPDLDIVRRPEHGLVLGVGAHFATRARRTVRPGQQNQLAVRRASAGRHHGPTAGAAAAPQDRHHLDFQRHQERGPTASKPFSGGRRRNGEGSGRTRPLPHPHRHRLLRRFLLHAHSEKGISKCKFVK
jgi:hypothetical protein